jgi:hypothetical protein
VISGDLPEIADQRRDATLASSDLLVVSTLGQLAENPRVVALRTFIEGWYLSYLSSNDARGMPDAGSMERLSQSGDNLSNVVQYLSENHPDRLRQILQVLSERVPRLERVAAEPLADGRLLLLIKDAPFREPFLARFASDGTLKMLAYLVLLYDPEPQPLGWRSVAQFAYRAGRSRLMHLEILVEEPSMAAALDTLVPRIVPNHTCEVHTYQGKPDLLGKLDARLRAYASIRSSWPDRRVVVVVDRDADDCPS